MLPFTNTFMQPFCHSSTTAKLWVGLCSILRTKCDLHLSCSVVCFSCVSTPSKVAEVVVLLTCIQEVFFSNLDQDTNYPNGLFCDFAHSFQTNARIITQLGNNSFFWHPFQFIFQCYLTICCCVVKDTDFIKISLR
jgi:hypothetical protein